MLLTNKQSIFVQMSLKQSSLSCASASWVVCLARDQLQRTCYVLLAIGKKSSHILLYSCTVLHFTFTFYTLSLLLETYTKHHTYFKQAKCLFVMSCAHRGGNKHAPLLLFDSTMTSIFLVNFTNSSDIYENRIFFLYRRKSE